MADAIVDPKPGEVEWKGHKLFRIPTDELGQTGMKVGLKKARGIVKHFEEIKKWVEKQDKKEKKGEL
ncbi:MAG: hypothetical protein KAS04_06040 [Candidatus Aenigmarchaeota archaeon]|nr:hypothetical protein [Candidatus Aenigmarchaeota archaeon]